MAINDLYPQERVVCGNTWPGPAPITESCGACGQEFPTLAQVFSHPCPGLPTYLRGYRPVTTPADNIDPPERHDGPATGTTSRPERTNRYPGKCIRCGGQVAAEAGLLVKDNSATRGSAWGVEHRHGQCPAAPDHVPETTPAPAAGGRPMTPAQEKFLRDLLAERQPDADADGVVAVVNDMPNPAAGASAMIDALKATPRPARPAPQAPTSGYEPARGDVHVVDGTYYRVHIAQQTRRPYACRWDGAGWTYDRGAMRLLSETTRATAEQAAAFGHMTGGCVFCSRAIDTPESTAVGYGPVCAAKHGLPWGSTVDV